MRHKQIGRMPQYYVLGMLIVGYYHHSVCMDIPTKSIAGLIAVYNTRNNGEVKIDPDTYYRWLSQQVWLTTPTPQASAQLNTALNLVASPKRVTKTRSLNVSKQHAHASVLLALGHMATEQQIAYTSSELQALANPLQATLSEDHLNLLLDTLTLRATNKQYYYRQKRFIVAALIIAGANANRPAKHSGVSPLGEAVLYDDAQAVTLLLHHGADPNVPLMADIDIPLIWHAPSVTVTKLLIDRGARLPAITHLSGCDKERYEQVTSLFTQYQHTVLEENQNL